MQLDRKEKLQIISIVLIILFGIVQLILNWPSPKLEVGFLEPRGEVYFWKQTISQIIIPRNITSPEIVSVSSNVSESRGDMMANFTFIIHNSGKGSAYDVTVKLTGEQENVCEVVSGWVFAGKSVQANFLTKTSSPYNEYKWGLLGACETFSITFYVKVNFDIAKEPKLILTITSENTDIIILYILIE